VSYEGRFLHVSTWLWIERMLLNSLCGRVGGGALHDDDWSLEYGSAMGGVIVKDDK